MNPAVLCRKSARSRTHSHFMTAAEISLRLTPLQRGHRSCTHRSLAPDRPTSHLQLLYPPSERDRSSPQRVRPLDGSSGGLAGPNADSGYLATRPTGPTPTTSPGVGVAAGLIP
jgi:hypothetical protein